MSDDLIAVTQADREAACAYLSNIAGLFGNDAVTKIRDDHPAVVFAATVRQQAEDAMREHCAEVALSPGFIEARDTEWDTGVNYAKRYIATAIRATPPKPDRLNGEGA